MLFSGVVLQASKCLKRCAQIGHGKEHINYFVIQHPVL